MLWRPAPGETTRRLWSSPSPGRFAFVALMGAVAVASAAPVACLVGAMRDLAAHSEPSVVQPCVRGPPAHGHAPAHCSHPSHGLPPSSSLAPHTARLHTVFRWVWGGLFLVAAVELAVRATELSPVATASPPPPANATAATPGPDVRTASITELALAAFGHGAVCMVVALLVHPRSALRSKAAQALLHFLPLVYLLAIAVLCLNTSRGVQGVILTLEASTSAVLVFPALRRLTGCASPRDGERADATPLSRSAAHLLVSLRQEVDLLALVFTVGLFTIHLVVVTGPDTLRFKTLNGFVSFLVFPTTAVMVMRDAAAFSLRRFQVQLLQLEVRSRGWLHLQQQRDLVARVGREGRIPVEALAASVEDLAAAVHELMRGTTDAHVRKRTDLPRPPDAAATEILQLVQGSVARCHRLAEAMAAAAAGIHDVVADAEAFHAAPSAERIPLQLAPFSPVVLGEQLRSAYAAKATAARAHIRVRYAGTLAAGTPFLKHRRSVDAAGMDWLRTLNAKAPQFLVGDGVRVRQVIGNLLDNALQWSPPDGVVTITMAVKALDSTPSRSPEARTSTATASAGSLPTVAALRLPNEPRAQHAPAQAVRSSRRRGAAFFPGPIQEEEEEEEDEGEEEEEGEEESETGRGSTAVSPYTAVCACEDFTAPFPPSSGGVAGQEWILPPRRRHRTRGSFDASLDSAASATSEREGSSSSSSRVPRAAAELRVSVSDQGPGIQAEDASRVFEPSLPQWRGLFQVSPTASNEQCYQHPPADATRGLEPCGGMGLAICRFLVHRMGGTLGVVRRPRGGCAFWFRLQLPVPAADDVAAEAVGAMMSNDTDSGSSSPLRRPAHGDVRSTR